MDGSHKTSICSRFRSTAAAYVDELFRRLREHGYDERTMTLWITGGGGCLVKHFGKVDPQRVRFVEDICAAAKGYDYLAGISPQKGAAPFLQGNTSLCASAILPGSFFLCG